MSARRRSPAGGGGHLSGRLRSSPGACDDGVFGIPSDWPGALVGSGLLSEALCCEPQAAKASTDHQTDRRLPQCAPTTLKTSMITPSQPDRYCTCQADENELAGCDSRIFARCVYDGLSARASASHDGIVLVPTVRLGTLKGRGARVLRFDGERCKGQERELLPTAVDSALALHEPFGPHRALFKIVGAPC